MSPDFLSLPLRPGKPRATGLTHVLDKGLPVSQTRALLEAAGEFVDIWKFGWGTAYLDRELDAKLTLLARHGVQACLGGTLLEIAWSQGRVEECMAWAAEVGVPLVEVSRGVMPMSLADKTRLIARAARSFTVLTEVGFKDPARRLDLWQWKDEVRHDLAAGAWLVITEGRESGTVGTYDASGEVIEEIVDAVVGVAGPERLLFEAPRRDQQAWCISRFGSDVNVGNIALDDVVNLEALRLGLRADTAVIRPAPASW
ncbi:phosphosulfolactate synthase [Terrabacter sp. GCM10028922]|uniref:phosphosulfolactate synthase n=1 Tax=Terrabacter sp. GCM10028922 TaxID=3273428 RepID=UPI003621AB21